MKEEENFVKVFKLVTGPGTEYVRHIFDTLIPPATLDATLSSHKNTTIKDLKRKRRITAAQDALLFPPSGAGASSITFDLSLMICLLRNLTTIVPPTNGWDALPPPTETSIGADIAKIKFVRNLLAHTDRNSMNDSDFNIHWSCLYNAILRQGGTCLSLQKKCDTIKALRLVSDVEIQDFISQVGEFKREFREEITEAKETVSNIQTDIKDLQRQLSTIPINIQEQFKMRIKEWQKQDIKFVETAGSKDVMKCVERNGCVSIIGNSGTGKTFIARHTALQMKMKGYFIIPLSEPHELDYFKHDHKTVFVIDDLCGKFTLNEIYLDDWIRVLEKIESFLKYKCCKIIATCRLQVYQDVKFKSMSIFRECTCNLSSSEFLLSPDEIVGFKDSYLPDEDSPLPELNKNIDFYPLLFSLYNNNRNKDIKTFFSDPFACYRKELKALENGGSGARRKYCGLVLCVLFNNTLSEDDIFGETTHRKEAIDTVLLRCGSENVPRRDILMEVKTLQDTFVKLVNNTFKIIHDKLFDFLALYFGNAMTDIFIKYSHPDFIKERFVFDSSNLISEEADSIILSDLYLPMLTNRLICLWEKGEVSIVFSNRIMKEAIFRKKMLNSLDQIDKLIQERLAAKIDILTFDTPLHGISFHGDVLFARWLIERNCALDLENTQSKTPLHIACEKGHVELVNWLLSFPINKNHRSKTGWTPLITACYNNHIQLVQQLINTKDVEIDIGDNEGRDSLYWSCNKGHVDVVILLLQQSFDINKPTKNGWTPLRTACYNNHIKVVKHLLLDDKINVDASDHEGRSPLYWACKRGNKEVVELLLYHQAQINSKDEHGMAPLHISCNHNHMDVIDKLLKNNSIKIDVCDQEGRTALYIACTNGYVDVVRNLLQLSANINTPNIIGWTPLHIASSNNHIEVVKNLLKSDQIVVDYRDKNGQNPLYIACERGNVDIVTLLLKHFIDVNTTDCFGNTPFLIACHNKHVNVVQELLKSDKIDVDISDTEGLALLHLACVEGNLDLVRWLLQHHAIKNTPDNKERKTVHTVRYINHDDWVNELPERNRIKMKTHDFKGWTPLHYACYWRQIEEAKRLLEIQQIDVNSCNDRGESSLHMASLQDNARVARLLLKHSANVNKQDKEGWTPLHTACYNNHVRTAKELMSSDRIDIDICDFVGRTSLFLACTQGHANIVTLLLMCSANINKTATNMGTALHTACFNDHVQIVIELLRCDQIDVEVRDVDGKTQLFLACEKGNVRVVNLLLQHSVNVNTSDNKSWTPLHIACYNNHVVVVRELLRCNQIDVEVRDVDGKTQLFLACEKGNVCVVNLLLQHAVNVNKTGNKIWTPLHIACYNNHVVVVRELLRCDQIDVEVRDVDGKTQLFLACEKGNVRVVNLLLQHSVNVNTSDNKSWTPLHIACYNNHVVVVRELLRCNQIDVEVRDVDGKTQFFLACEKGNVCVVNLLLQHSVNVNTADNKSWTPLHAACYNNHLEVVKVLLENGEVDVDVCDNYGSTSLYLACSRGNVGVVISLLQHSANITKPNKSGETPIQVACCKNYVEVVQELLKYDFVDVDVGDGNGNTLLDLASQRANLDMVKLLLQHFVNISTQYERDLKLLKTSCDNNHVDVARELLMNNQIDADLCNNNGTTSLHLACSEVKVDLDSLQQHANINKPDKDGWTPLHIACDNNDEDVVKELLENDKIDVDIRDNHGRTSLYLACLTGNVNLVRLLLQHSANINLPDKDGWTPLHTACIYHHVRVVTELLKSDSIEVEVSTKKWQFLFKWACKRGNIDMVRLLLQHSADINKPDTIGWTSLHAACDNNNVDLVAELLQINQIDVDVCLIDGRTSLHLACYRGNVDVVGLLLQHSANINKQDKDDWTPLHIACIYNHVEIVKELLKNEQIDVDVCDKEDRISLHWASQNSNIQVVRLLLPHSVSINKPDKNGWTSLHMACYNNNVEVVTELLKSDQIDVDVCDNERQSPLYTACKGGNFNVVRLQLQHSADINQPDNAGLTPLHIACYQNHVTVVQELLNSDKIDVDLCSNEGATSLYLASQEGNVDIVRIMLQQSANINKQDKDGWTPLHIACYKNNLDVVTELLNSNNIDVDCCDNEGTTSLYLACDAGNENIVMLLLQSSADVNKSDRYDFTPLIIACQRMHTEVVQELLTNRAEVNAKTYDGDNALLSASREGSTEIVEILLQKGSNPNACIHPKRDIESYISISERNLENEIKYWYKDISGKLSDKLVEYLQTKPKDYAFEIAAGSSSLHFASLLGYSFIAKLLLHNKADVNMTKEDGTTPLFYACEFGQIEVVKLLLDEGATTDLGRNEGMKPLDIATINGHSDVVSCLMKHDNMFADLCVPEDQTKYCQRKRVYKQKCNIM